LSRANRSLSARVRRADPLAASRAGLLNFQHPVCSIPYFGYRRQRLVASVRRARSRMRWR